MTMTPDEQRIVDRMRTLLSERFGLYRPEHLVCIGQLTENKVTRTMLMYRSKNVPLVTNMSLQWEGERAYILTFFIDLDQQGKGYGRQLYEVGKALCKEHGCTHIRTTPSGDGITFWPKMGFQPCEAEWDLEARI